MPDNAITRDAFLYLAPGSDYPPETFALCASCVQFAGRSCLIMESLGDTVEPDHSCGAYLPGGPAPTEHAVAAMDLVTPADVGYVRHPTQCRRCVSFDASNSTCRLYRGLNEAMPTGFALDERVDQFGCCNAHRLKSESNPASDVESSQRAVGAILQAVCGRTGSMVDAVRSAAPSRKIPRTTIHWQEREDAVRLFNRVAKSHGLDGLLEAMEV